MPNPTISPAIWAAGAVFTVTDSPFAAIDVFLDELDEDTGQVLLTVPAGAAVIVQRDPLSWIGPGTTILTGGVWTVAPVPLGDWTLIVTPGALATDQATIAVSSVTNGANGRLRLSVTGLSGVLSAEAGGGTVSIDRVLAAPTITNPQVSSGLPVREKGAVSLSATVTQSQRFNGAPVLALPAAPALVSVWVRDPANTLALTDFASVGATATFTAPAVYANTMLNFTLRSALDLDASGSISGADPLTTAPLPVEVLRVRYGMVLVLDRSGSMSSGLSGAGLSKWDAATQAAHAWSDLFRAFRPGNDHQAGVVTFDHDACNWTASPLDEVTFRSPSTSAALAAPNQMVPLSGFGQVTTWNLGGEANCTPIGDGLVRAWQGIGTHLQPVDKAAVILMTDGFENSGRVTIAATKGDAAATFATERVTPALQAANNIIGNRVYTLALGTSVDEDRLQVLGSAIYRQITTDLAEVTPAFAEMLGHVLDAEPLNPEPPLQPDPDEHDNALYYRVSTGEQVLAFLATWGNATDKLRIGHRPQGSAASFTLVSPGPATTVTQRATHGLTRVDLRLLFAGSPPATEWRLQHMNAANDAQPGLGPRALAMVDLTTKVEISFDKRDYFVGDAIHIHARVASGGIGIPQATISVGCARPGEGLGTFLAQNGPRYVKIQRDTPNDRGGDPANGKGLMFQTMLKANGIEALPIVNSAVFSLRDDGAHQDGAAGDGHYANAFTDSAKEGTYTFVIWASGQLADGSQFSRRFVRSVWVGVRPAPSALNPQWIDLTVAGVLPRMTQMTITPMSLSGEYLGPFRADKIVTTVHGGKATGDLIDNLDGSYALRVETEDGSDPLVGIDIYGTPMTPTGPSIGHTPEPPLGTDCWRLWRRAMCCTWVALRKILTGK